MIIQLRTGFLVLPKDKLPQTSTTCVLGRERIADEDTGGQNQDRDHPIWIHVAIWKNKYSKMRSCGTNGAVGDDMSGTV